MAQDTRFPAQFFENYLDHESEAFLVYALLCLAQETEDNPKLAAKYNSDLRTTFLDELISNEDNLRKLKLSS
jgi:AAA family ATP:ADP antiporter